MSPRIHRLGHRNRSFFFGPRGTGKFYLLRYLFSDAPTFDRIQHSETAAYEFQSSGGPRHHA